MTEHSPVWTIDALDSIAREANRQIRQEISEALGEKANYPTVSPAAVRIILNIAASNLAADHDTLVEANQQSDKDWLAMYKAIAQTTADATEWELADDATLMEEFDPWDVLRAMLDEMGATNAPPMG